MKMKKIFAFTLAMLTGLSGTVFAFPDKACAAELQNRTVIEKTSPIAAENLEGKVQTNSLNEVFVDSKNGSDTTGDGSLNNPVNTLEKAYDTVVNQGIIVLKENILLSSCIRVAKEITIRSEGANKYSITRADNFKTASDNNRSWYNPAMFEIGGTGSFTVQLENIILDDANKSEGTEYKKQGMGNSGEDTTKNLQIVQDAIIAIYNPDTKINMINTDLLNFAGLSALLHESGALNYQSGIVSGGAAQTLAAAIRSYSGATIGEGVTIKNLQDGIGIYTISKMLFGGQILNTTTTHAMQLGDNANVTLSSTSKINGNTSTFAGVVYARGTGTMLTIDGEVSNNKTNVDNSGAFYVYGASVMIEDNAKIMNNQSSDPSKLSPSQQLEGKTAGAGIFASENANITMNGGIISGNNSLGGATVLGNASGYTGGGGVSLVRNSSFTMNGGKIVNNNSNSYGGGIMLHVDRQNYTKGKVVLNGGEISGNTASNNTSGHDVYISGFNLNKYFATTSGNYISVNENMLIGDGIANGKTQMYATNPISFGHVLNATHKLLQDFADTNGYEAVTSVWIRSEQAPPEILFEIKAPQYDPKVNDLYVAYIPVDELTGQAVGSDIKVQSQTIVNNGIAQISIDTTAKSKGKTYGVLLMKGPHVNIEPVINAADQVLTVGDIFNPLDGVTAHDAEDGAITLTNANIAANNVDTSKAGTYHVTYRVTDKNNASVKKTITIIVKESTKPTTNDKINKPEPPTKPVTPNKTVTSTKKSKAPKMGDMTNITLFSSMFIGSVGGLGLLFTKRKKKK